MGDNLGSVQEENKMDDIAGIQVLASGSNVYRPSIALIRLRPTILTVCHVSSGIAIVYSIFKFTVYGVTHFENHENIHQ